MSQPFHHLVQVLNSDELIQMEHLISEAAFVDGKSTATMAAKEVKNNLQIDPLDKAYTKIQQLINKALQRNVHFQASAQPKQIHPFLISKYGVGQQYGWHVDSPLMGDPMVRTDMAMTIFLSDPTDYEGGELVLSGPAGPVGFKPAKGDAILYPCQFLHCVTEIKKGERIAAVTWLQSNIQSSEQRQLLFELNQVHSFLQQQAADSPATAQLLQTYSNLFRMWADV